MQTLKREELLEKLEILKPGEVIYIDINEDLTNVLKLLDLKIGSYQNLFKSYIDSKNQSPNKLNIDEFFERYTEKYSQYNYLKEEMLKEALGECYEYFKLNKRIRHNFILDLKVIEIFTIGGKVNV